jgi:hypothetical protein
MPSIRSQKIDSTGIQITASNGKTFSVTTAKVLSNFKSQLGTTAQKKALTLSWLKSNIESALGKEEVPVSKILNIDFDTITGTVTVLKIQ